MGEEQDGGNAVEDRIEVEDTNECLIYEGKICHHRCINTPSSFHCECFPGYVLQEDAFTCVPGNGEDHQSCFVTVCGVSDAAAAGREPICWSGFDLESAFLSGRPRFMRFVDIFTMYRYYFPGLFEFLPVCKLRCCLIIVILIILSRPFPGLQCSANCIFAAFDKFIMHRALKTWRIKACSCNSVRRVCQTSSPRACPDGILMPGLLNYSEGWGSPIKPNVCLQAVSFSGLMRRRRRCSFHPRPLASHFWPKMQKLHEVDAST